MWSWPNSTASSADLAVVETQVERLGREATNLALYATETVNELADDAVQALEDAYRSMQAARRQAPEDRAVPLQRAFQSLMALHAEGSYEDVLALLTDGLSWTMGDGGPLVLPSKSAIFQARDRLGAEPIEVLFDRVA